MNHTISIEKNRKELSALSGLIFFKDLIDYLNLERVIGPLLPKRKRQSGMTAGQKFLLGIYAFICGAECITDLDYLRLESLFSKIAGSLCSTAMGKFLYRFKLKEIEKIQELLITVVLKLRSKLNLDKKIILAMDSTSHRQYGKFMEGVEYSGHKGYDCLSSQNLFDQYGLCYGWHLRSGATHTSIDATLMLEKILPKLKTKHIVEFCADSGYAGSEIYNCLINHKVNFAICLPETVWGALLDRYEFKMGFKKTRLQFFDSNKCQIGSCLYTSKKINKAFLRVVFIRAKKKKLKKEDKRYYDYYAIITSFTQSEKSDEEVVRFYRKRANCENFIKDLKYGLDFLHFPCQKLNANRAWGLMGIFAYNLMKYASYLISPGKGCFMKKVRQKMLYIPCEIATHARKLKLRFHQYYFKEVNRLQKLLHIKLRLSFYPPVGRGLPAG